MFARLGLLCLLALLLALPAGASAAVVSGAGEDPAGDHTGGGASADLVALRASYDDGGTISGRVTVAGAPPAGAAGFAFLFFGVAQPDGSCSTVVGLGDALGADRSDPRWGPPSDPTAGTATRTAPDAATIALSATAPELAGRPLDCAFAATSADGATVDRAGPVALRAPAADPPPQPRAGGPSAPKPGSGKPRAARRPVARLRLTVKAPRALAVGRSARLRVVVANDGRAVARGVRLRLSARNLAVAPATRALGALRPRARRTVAIRLIRRARGAATVRLRAIGAGRLSAARTVTIALPKPRRTAKPKPRPKPTPQPSAGLGGLAFLRLVPGSPGISQDTRTGYVFTGPRWVHRGTPENGMPSCSRRTAGPAADDEGCLPYRYDARSGRLEIDGRPARLSADRSELTVGEQSFLLKQGFAAGARLSVSLKNIEVYGLWPNQSVFTSWLTLTAGGEFAFSGSAIGSLGSGGPSLISSTIAPDQRGTYAIGNGSTIVFRYADGRVERRMILVDGTPKGGAGLDPQREGLLLDGTAWWS